ncbi:hypothetical protein OG889_10330 [Streptomyces sp. NBC_00481]|uniref:hypothetical protein n=1 Tax=Streptomyces sp. NBC_00481 TaxID=2975755 RepID=UPI002DDC7A98|nr:hypothetical protein [Streptomyces sp. NBC_00481]WRY95092.1 hypothetical protein OG889_10330 [Streptomyces sp. NBC_00481]
MPHPDAPDSTIEIQVGGDGGAAPSVHRFTVPDEPALYLEVAEGDGPPPAAVQMAGTLAREPFRIPSVELTKDGVRGDQDAVRIGTM